MKELFDMMATMQGAKDPQLLRTILSAVMLRDLNKDKMTRNAYPITIGEIDDIICAVDMLLVALKNKPGAK
jgi:hypothetical protein